VGFRAPRELIGERSSGTPAEQLQDRALRKLRGTAKFPRSYC